MGIAQRMAEQARESLESLGEQRAEEDEHQFVLSCRIMWTESDVDLVTEIIEETQEKHPGL